MSSVEEGHDYYNRLFGAIILAVCKRLTPLGIIWVSFMSVVVRSKRPGSSITRYCAGAMLTTSINKLSNASPSSGKGRGIQGWGFDHGAGHSLLLLYDAKASHGLKSKEFKDLGHGLSNASISLFKIITTYFIFITI